jgi:hypothetical protein
MSENISVHCSHKRTLDSDNQQNEHHIAQVIHLISDREFNLTKLQLLRTQIMYFINFGLKKKSALDHIKACEMHEN